VIWENGGDVENQCCCVNIKKIWIPEMLTNSKKRKLNVSSNSIEIERGETSTVQKKVRVKQTNGAVSVP
jgi:hypothetical protein